MGRSMLMSLKVGGSMSSSITWRLKRGGSLPADHDWLPADIRGATCEVLRPLQREKRSAQAPFRQCVTGGPWERLPYGAEARRRDVVSTQEWQARPASRPCSTSMWHPASEGSAVVLLSCCHELRGVLAACLRRLRLLRHARKDRVQVRACSKRPRGNSVDRDDGVLAALERIDCAPCLEAEHPVGEGDEVDACEEAVCVGGYD